MEEKIPVEINDHMKLFGNDPDEVGERIMVFLYVIAVIKI
jgi:hypothetical protein